MRSVKSAQRKHPRLPRLAIALRLAGFLLLLPGQLLSAQYVPIVSGAVGFFDSKNTGINFFQPVFAPVVVAPPASIFWRNRDSICVVSTSGIMARRDPTKARLLDRPSTFSWIIS